MRITAIVALVAAAAALTGCGNTLEEQAATGALGGALVGTAVDAPLAGAAAGGAVGTGSALVD